MSILRENQALVPPFSLQHLPPLHPGSAGAAAPNPGADTIVCIAPGSAKTYNANWGQELTLHLGDPHVALAPDDHYPNQVLVRDCQIAEPVSYDDPRAQALLEFWQAAGFSLEDLVLAWQQFLGTFASNRRPHWAEAVLEQVDRGNVFFVAQKTQPALVIGRVDLRFMTSEGETELAQDMVLLLHPEDPTNVWAIRRDQFAKRYTLHASLADALEAVAQVVTDGSTVSA